MVPLMREADSTFHVESEINSFALANMRFIAHFEERITKPAALTAKTPGNVVFLKEDRQETALVIS